METSLQKLTDEGDYTITETGIKYTYAIDLYEGDGVIINQTVKNNIDKVLFSGNQKFIQVKGNTIAIGNIRQIRKRYI